MQDFITNYGLPLSYILLAVAFLAAVVAPLITIMQDPKQLVKTAIALGAVVIVFFVAFSVSPADDVAPRLITKFNISEGLSKYIGAGLVVTYLLMVGSMLAIVFNEVSRLFK